MLNKKLKLHYSTVTDMSSNRVTVGRLVAMIMLDLWLGQLNRPC